MSTRQMLPCVHAVMLLIEATASDGPPTAEQVEAAILGDHEPRELEDVYSQHELARLGAGGDMATDKARAIHMQAEFYRLELTRVLRMYHQQYDKFAAEVNELSVQCMELDKRCKTLEKRAHAAEDDASRFRYPDTTGQ